jgi:hypothetical protein
MNGGLPCHGRSEPVKRTRTSVPRQSVSYNDIQPSPLPHHHHSGSQLSSTSQTFFGAASPSVSHLRSTQGDGPYFPHAGPSNYSGTQPSVDPAYLLQPANPVIDPIPLETSTQYNWLKDGHSEPFAFLNTNFDSSLHVDAVPQQWNQTSFWDDFGSFLVPQMNTSPFDPTTAAGLESRLLYVPGATNNPMRRGVSLAEICECLPTRRE